jgi:hypothetical protein
VRKVGVLGWTLASNFQWLGYMSNGRGSTLHCCYLKGNLKIKKYQLKMILIVVENDFFDESNYFKMTLHCIYNKELVMLF